MHRSSPYDRANLIADFDSIRISLASPEKIRSSSGARSCIPSQSLVIRLNGKTVNEFTAHKDASGCIGLQTMQNSHVSFRQVRLVELKSDEKNLTVEGL